jgi:hypothetical protein
VSSPYLSRPAPSIIEHLSSERRGQLCLPNACGRRPRANQVSPKLSKSDQKTTPRVRPWAVQGGRTSPPCFVRVPSRLNVLQAMFHLGLPKPVIQFFSCFQSIHPPEPSHPSQHFPMPDCLSNLLCSLVNYSNILSSLF